LGVGGLLAVLAGLIWSLLPVPDEQIAQLRPVSATARGETFPVGDVLEQKGGTPAVVAVQDARAGPGHPPASAPGSPNAGPPPDEKGPILGGPKPQVATLPDSTPLFGTLGTEAVSASDQRIVSGDVELLGGNHRIVFING
jgi:hypothetical protein